MDFAIAPCTWGVYWPTGNELTWDDYLARSRAAGYRSTELGPYGFGPTDADAMGASLARHGLSVVAGAHVHTLAKPDSWAKLEQDSHAICTPFLKRSSLPRKSGNGRSTF